MKFVDPKNDLAFKKIFGDANKTEILISLLNALLNLPHDIVSLNNVSPYQPPLIKELKDSSLDVKAIDSTGREFIVEMQVEPNEHFGKRAFYYLAKAFVNQINRGDAYAQLKPAYFLGFLNFNLFDGDNYATRHILINQSTGNQDLNFIDFNFVELKKFNKTENDLSNIVDKWIFFIKNAWDLDHIPESTTEKALLEAYDVANQGQWSKRELETYDYFSMKEGDIINERKTAIKNAENKGFAIGKAESEKIIEVEKLKRKQAEKEKLQAEKEKLQAEKNKINMILELNKNNVPINVIATSSNLTENEVEKILNTNKGGK